VVGCFGATDYSGARVAIQPGDVLVLYSDGVSEARHGEGEEFGESGIAGVVSSSLDDPAESLLLKLIETARAHAGQPLQGDDMTVVVVKRCR
jgi:sigma-B regulation protein RsbU (phosphoserine phosphatase)